MNQFRTLTALIAAGLSIASVDALACGESMFHTGQGMRYHAFITRRPATILVYSPGQWKSGAAQAELYSGLEKAGHKVTVVGDADALTQALAAHQYDVVIASSGEMDAIAAHIVKTAREPNFIAVINRDAGDERQLRERYPRNVREGDDLNQYLKSIEQTMQTRGS
jgi:hypothetical protein